MLIDVHTHIWKAEHWSAEMAQEASIARGGPAEIDIREEDHWAAMAPVDRAIVFGMRAAHSGLVVPNKLIADYVATHPEKLIGFAGIDPYEPDYLDQLHECCESQGFRGVKLGPIYQNYHVSDPRMKPVYEYCEKRGLPILFHQGTTFPRKAPLKFAQPADLEEVALDYPDLVMIIAHMGHPWMDETTALIRKQPNVYADISALYYRPWQFYNGLIIAQEYGAAHKLLFGTDYPFTTPAETVERLKDVNHVTAGGMPRVSDKTIYGILERDSLSLLHLS